MHPLKYKIGSNNQTLAPRSFTQSTGRIERVCVVRVLRAHVRYVQYNIIQCTSILVETDTVPCDAISWSHNTRKSHSAQTYPAFSQKTWQSILAIAAPPALQVTDPSEVSL